MYRYVKYDGGTETVLQTFLNISSLCNCDNRCCIEILSLINYQNLLLIWYLKSLDPNHRLSEEKDNLTAV